MSNVSPKPFTAAFVGPEGPYCVRFTPKGRNDGEIAVTIEGQAMRWPVDDIGFEGGGTVFSGMTLGTDDLWGNTFWFEVLPSASPPVIRYWLDRVVWREDAAARS